jgi:DNA polymerase III epsilon subunit-like protein
MTFLTNVSYESLSLTRDYILGIPAFERTGLFTPRGATMNRMFFPAFKRPESYSHNRQKSFQFHVSYSMRYVCLDFETNGFPKPGDWTLPFSSFPIQLAVDIVEDGEVTHAYDTVIAGATSLAPWVQDNVHITLAEIRRGTPFRQVLEDLAGIIQDGDIIVAHNASFDINTAIGRTAERLGIQTPALLKILQTPRFCTMRCAYTKSLKGGSKMKDLCAHFQVTLENAHDARGDSAALAECVAVAWRRGVMLEERTTTVAEFIERWVEE